MTNYKIDGVEIVCPSEVRWGERKNYGVDGNNVNIQSAVRSFVMNWDAMTPEEFNSVYQHYLNVIDNGSVTADLPEFPGVTEYSNFETYAGVVIDEPTVGPYFAGYYTNVSMTLRNIVTP